MVAEASSRSFYPLKLLQMTVLGARVPIINHIGCESRHGGGGSYMCQHKSERILDNTVGHGSTGNLYIALKTSLEHFHIDRMINIMRERGPVHPMPLVHT